MKTSKVKAIESIKEWGDGDRKTFYHNLEMDNGDKINLGKKKELEIGAELTYEITGDEQHEYRKAKTINPEFNASQPTGDNLKGIKIGHAINNAVNLHCALGLPENVSPATTAKGSIKEYAKMIYIISEELNNEI